MTVSKFPWRKEDGMLRIEIPVEGQRIALWAADEYVGLFDVVDRGNEKSADLALSTIVTNNYISNFLFRQIELKYKDFRVSRKLNDKANLNDMLIGRYVICAISVNEAVGIDDIPSELFIWLQSAGV